MYGNEIREMAERARARLAANDSVELREQIVDTAEEVGMFLIWLDVFKDDVDMQCRLRKIPNPI